MQEMQDWLIEAENYLAMVPPISRLVETIEEQLDIHKIFNDSVQIKCHFMKELNNKGIRVQLSCEKKDAIPMKNRLVSLKHRTDKLTQRSNERLRTLNISLDDSRLFFIAQQELIDWINEQFKLLDEKENEKLGTGDRIRELLEEHRKLQDQINRRNGLYEETRLRGNMLSEHAPTTEKRKIELENDKLVNEWTELGKRILKRQRSLEEALIQSGHFDEILAELLEWLGNELPPIENELLTQNYFGDIDTINILMREHFELVERVETRKPNVKKVQERAQKILESKGGDPQELDQLLNRLNLLDGQWKRLGNSIAERDQRFTTALKKSVDLSEMIQECNDEGKQERLQTLIDEQQMFKSDLQQRQPELDELIKFSTKRRSQIGRKFRYYK
ncbi:GAR domain-containing protein [Meloidogyne graminicola]|uniref:GAR domain-containing protein n=1 Tax=Meloidogyne graminicola TaxID=189291 RepID=A0A8S9ZS32_9BILA|nr:GAR domain-containing protein [Meloidogyne graminicola]